MPFLSIGQWHCLALGCSVGLLATGLVRLDVCDMSIEWSWPPAPRLWVNGQELLARTWRGSVSTSLSLIHICLLHGLSMSRLLSQPQVCRDGFMPA